MLAVVGECTHKIYIFGEEAYCFRILAERFPTTIKNSVGHGKRKELINPDVYPEPLRICRVVEE